MHFPLLLGLPKHARLFHSRIGDTVDAALLSKLRDVISTADVKAINGFFDWDAIQRQHFPKEDPLRLAYLHEFYIKSDISRQTKIPEFNRNRRAIFSEEMDKRLLECIDRTDWSPEQKFAHVGGNFPPGAYEKRANHLKRKHKIHAIDEQIRRMRGEGLSIELIATRLDLSPAAIRIRVNRLDGQDSMKTHKEHHPLSVLVRRQFNVLGADWHGLAGLARVDKQTVRRLVNAASPKWDIFKTSFSDPQPAGSDWRHSMRYDSSEIARLVALVEQYRYQSGPIDWIYIAQQMNRTPDSCQNHYEDYYRRIRNGFYSREEDRQLLDAFIKSGGNVSMVASISRSTVNRPYWSIKGRVDRLIYHISKGEGSGHQLAVELGNYDRLMEIIHRRRK